jgi:hypothetical protein
MPLETYFFNIYIKNSLSSMEDQDLDNFISIMNYIGKVDNGVAVDLSLKVKEEIYHLIYWFDKDDNYKISAENKFLTKFNLSSIYEYKNYKKLAFYIHKYINIDLLINIDYVNLNIFLF